MPSSTSASRRCGRTGPEDFHLAGEVLGLATGLIVHSHYVHDRARAAGYDGPIWIVPHPAFPVPTVPAVEIPGDPLFGTFGNVNSSKRVPQLLEAFARVRQERSVAGLLLVGATSPGFDLDRRLQRLGLDGGGLVREGYVDESRLWALMQACDVHVNLRSPTMGETSGTAIRALALGKPLVVSDVGWFSELPSDVALKVPVDDDEVDTLVAALELLASRPDVRAAMGAAALELARTEHDLDRVADRYVAAFEQAAGGGAVSDAVLREVSRGGCRGRDRARLGRGDAPSPLASARSSSVAERLGPLPAWAMAHGRSSSSRSPSGRGWRDGMLGPFIMVDELIYSEMAKSFAVGPDASPSAAFPSRGTARSIRS